MAGGSYYDDANNAGPLPFLLGEKNGVWGDVQRLPWGGGVLSVSCADATNCAATGAGFVISETNGVWGTPVSTPSYSSDGNMSSVSCGSPGDCVVGGDYYTPGPPIRGTTRFAPGSQLGFLMSSKNGVWGAPMDVPGMAALQGGPGGEYYVESVSCSGAGDCARRSAVA